MSVSQVELKSLHLPLACHLEIEVGTNCPQGGDAGHGGRTVFRLIDRGGTCLGVSVKSHDKNEEEVVFDEGDVSDLTITLLGDNEADAFIEALEFAIKTYKEQDPSYRPVGFAD